jgi:hypothetical protein
MRQEVKDIKPVGPKSPLPDYSKAKPDKRIRRYRVLMHVNTRPGNYPIIFHVSSGGKRLRPWQAYAGYDVVSGGSILNGMCGDGFVVSRAFGQPEASPESDGNTAVFALESATGAGKWDLDLGYTCARKR